MVFAEFGVSFRQTLRGEVIAEDYGEGVADTEAEFCGEGFSGEEGDPIALGRVLVLLVERRIFVSWGFFTLSVQIPTGDIVAHMLETWVYLLFDSISWFSLKVGVISVSETPYN